jgi:hypothetical protein
MELDNDKIDDTVLALLHLTSFQMGGLIRSWKGLDWEALNRLHDKGMISDPKSKSKSVVLSEEGQKRARELFTKYFQRT